MNNQEAEVSPLDIKAQKLNRKEIVLELTPSTPTSAYAGW